MLRLRFDEIINLNLQFVKRLEVLEDIFSLNQENNNKSEGVCYARYSKTFLCSFNNGSMTMFATGILALSWRNFLYPAKMENPVNFLVPSKEQWVATTV